MNKTTLFALFTGVLFWSLTMGNLFAAPEIKAVTAHKADREACAALDEPSKRAMMDGLLFKLLIQCGRQDELGGVENQFSTVTPPLRGGGEIDVQVNDTSAEEGAGSTTQSETALAVNPTTGTICSGFNDSWHNFTESLGFTGFARSTDSGLTFTDGGALGANSSGDPSIVWRQADGNFYFAALETMGLGTWVSSDDCQTFQYLGNNHVGGSDDKELMAVDNNVTSAYSGRLYVAWTDFSDSRIKVTSSDDGINWSTPVAVSDVGASVQGAWPVVAPNGDIFVGWLRWNPFPSGPIDIEIVRSVDGGATFTAVTAPVSGIPNPRDVSATATCGRPALNGNIRYLPSPQIAVGADGVLHVVYSRDPDGFDTGDVVDVYYRRSGDSGATWDTEIRINDDTTLNDQFFPSLSVGETGIVSVSWSDRRLDPANLMYDTYQRKSFDGGVTFQPNERISDASSPVYLDPNLANCYHGDYNQEIQFNNQIHVQWSDDRNIQSGHNDPDVFLNSTSAGVDFVIASSQRRQDVCLPADLVYNMDILQFNSFVEPVDLLATGVPGTAIATFSASPVTPPGTSDLTLSNTGTIPVGENSFMVVGTSAPGGIVHDIGFSLTAFDQTPDLPLLTMPADAAVNQPYQPVLSWQASAQAQSYTLEVANDAGFGNIVLAQTLNNTTYTVDSGLDPETTYYWRVLSTNICGAGTYSTPFSFTVRQVPPVLLVDDDDNGPDIQGTYRADLDALGIAYDVFDTNNSDNEPSTSGLAPYQVVLWFTGDEFGGTAGPGTTGEADLGAWLDGAGRCLILSSQDYLFDRGVTTFAQSYLGIDTFTSDVAQTVVTGDGSVFGGLGPFTLAYPFTNYSDTVNPDASAEIAFVGNLGNAAVNKTTPAYSTVFLGFPLAAIGEAERRSILQSLISQCTLTETAFADSFEGK